MAQNKSKARIAFDATCRDLGWHTPRRAVITIVITIIVLVGVFLVGGKDQGVEELIVKAAVVCAAMLIFPFVFLWEIAAPEDRRKRSKTMSLALIIIGLVITVAGIAVIGIGASQFGEPNESTSGADQKMAESIRAGTSEKLQAPPNAASDLPEPIPDYHLVKSSVEGGIEWDVNHYPRRLRDKDTVAAVLIGGESLFQKTSSKLKSAVLIDHQGGEHEMFLTSWRNPSIEREKVKEIPSGGYTVLPKAKFKLVLPFTPPISTADYIKNWNNAHIRVDYDNWQYDVDLDSSEHFPDWFEKGPK